LRSWIPDLDSVHICHPIQFDLVGKEETALINLIGEKRCNYIIQCGCVLFQVVNAKGFYLLLYLKALKTLLLSPVKLKTRLKNPDIKPNWANIKSN